MSDHLIQADVLDWLRANQWQAQNGFLPKYHAVLCDPPYFLGSITKRFGKPDSKPAQYGRDGAYGRVSAGFMGQQWDGFDSVWHYQDWVTEWATLLLDFVYPGALLMAFGGTRTYHRLASGLEDAGWDVTDSMHYLYGTGFPKNHNVGGGYGTALKPAFEPVVIARAPRGSTTFAQLAQQYGTGAFNIDGSRIETGDSLGGGMVSKGRPKVAKGWDRPWMHDPDVTERKKVESAEKVALAEQLGRYPANLLLDEEAAALLDAQSGELRNGGGNANSPEREGMFGVRKPPFGGTQYAGDKGGASRFFYTAKASSFEREAGLEDFTPQTVNDGRQTPIDNPYQRGETLRRATHPTMKPLRLNEYLARLILPPEAVGERRLLIPFAGVASEMIGAHLAGWDVVTGLEREAEYIEQGQARLRWWTQFDSYEAAKAAHDAARKQRKQPSTDDEAQKYQQQDMFALAELEAQQQGAD
jgi:site-specific DNA-methyltransferase (adenine-specific)